VSFGVLRRRPAGRGILVSVAFAAYLALRATLGRGGLTLGSRKPPFADDLRGRPVISHSIAPFVVDVMATLRLRRDGATSLPRDQAPVAHPDFQLRMVSAVASRLAVVIGGVGDVRRGGEGPDRAAS
jgi:hypothetical protein